MSDLHLKPSQKPEHQDWNPARPDIIPEPTPWPASLALAVTLSLWGLATSFLITGIGVGLFAISIVGWIGEIRRERRTK
ncbi:MAG TPA: hypothetical protein VG146_09410 [Verrucomicrobiae bacterium]|nr:hypothetical protein [Verrucomicrobiae bacterium]